MANRTNFKDCIETTVFRLLVARLQADPVLSREIKASSFRAWTGEPSESADITVSQMPALRMTPVPAGSEWDSPNEQMETFVVEVELWVPGTCVDDALNAWSAVRDALYPAAGTADDQAWRAKLRAAGCRDGMITIHAPAMAPHSDNGSKSTTAQKATGQLGLNLPVTT